jgi:hypothetical protein
MGLGPISLFRLRHGAEVPVVLIFAVDGPIAKTPANRVWHGGEVPVGGWYMSFSLRFSIPKVPQQLRGFMP